MLKYRLYTRDPGPWNKKKKCCCARVPDVYAEGKFCVFDVQSTIKFCA